MTPADKDKIKIVNFLIKLQEAIYAADEVSAIEGFNKNQTKMLLNRLMDTIQKEHGVAIKGLWDEKETQMHDVMKQVQTQSSLLYQIPFYMSPDLCKVLDQFIKDNFASEL
jgi:hypothetical protein